MRADRLLATLLLLQARGQVTAADVADELEVSTRTARRDLEALAAAGIPVYSQPGRGGGWRILGGLRTDLSGLSVAEARALFLVAGASSQTSAELRTALRKLVQALPATFRAGAEAAAQAMVVDPGPWGRAVEEPSVDIETLQRAVIERVRLRLEYDDRAGRPTSRVVHPLGLVVKGQAWYLVAGTREGLRTFRVSRIRAATLTGEAAVVPAGFDLAATWQAIAQVVERDRRRVTARVVADTEMAAGLRAQFGTDAEITGDAADGRLELAIHARSLAVLADQLAGWGGRIEVSGPRSLRRRLARVGRELVVAYGTPEASASDRVASRPGRSPSQPAARRS